AAAAGATAGVTGLTADAAAQEAASAAQDAAEAAAETADAATVAARIEALLTPEGFDRAQVDSIIDGSAIPDTQKQTLKQLVSQAEGDPALLAAALEQVKAVMR
ncbi:hypothetical protein SY26_00160, partial [Paracoccus sp. 228]